MAESEAGLMDVTMDVTDYNTQLEKIALLFLELLQHSINFDTHLASVTAVCQIIQFLYSNNDLRQICCGQLHEKATQTHNTDPTDLPKTSQQSRIQTSGERSEVERKLKMEPECNIEGPVTRGRASKRQAKITAKRKKAVGSTDHNTSNKEELDQIDTTAFSENSNEDFKVQPPIYENTFTKPDTLSEFQCSYCYKEFIDKRNLKSHLWIHERKKSFQCDICCKMFLRSHQLTRHKRVHTGEKPYPCPVCGRAFADVSNLNTHKRKEHPYHASAIKCTECGKECQSKRELLSHEKSHSKNAEKTEAHGLTTDFMDNEGITISKSTAKLRLQQAQLAKNQQRTDRICLCQICGKYVNNRAALVAHWKRHTRTKGFRCEYCNKAFTELRDLKVHLHVHTGERPYKCEECGKGFKSQGTLRSHMGVHSGVQRYSCDVCGRAFSQTSGLNLHKLKHTAEEERTMGSRADPSQHRCDICGRCYKTKFRLQLHTKSHDSKRDVSCDFCDKKFQTPHDLAIHRRSHTKDKYLCRVCGASFKSRSVYYFHTKTHAIDRPHLCSECGKSFVSANDLNAHKRRHTPGATGKKSHDRFICTVCGRIYQMKNSLTIHMKIHQGIFDHPCDFCEKKFKSHAELRHHRRVHTQEKPYICETCHRCFSRHSTLVNHRRTHSGERPYLCGTCGAAFKLSCTLKKHAKIHTRETVGGKTRSGKSKLPRSAPPPLPSVPAELQPSPHLQPQLHPEHLQQQLQLQPLHQVPTQQVSHPAVSIGISQLMGKPANILMDPREQTHFIQELKPTATSIIQGDTTGLIHERTSTSLLLDPRNSTATDIQQQLREPIQNEGDDRDTPRNLIEIRNAVPNSLQYNAANHTFTSYYYY